MNKHHVYFLKATPQNGLLKAVLEDAGFRVMCQRYMTDAYHASYGEVEKRAVALYGRDEFDHIVHVGPWTDAERAKMKEGLPKPALDLNSPFEALKLAELPVSDATTREFEILMSAHRQQQPHKLSDAEQKFVKQYTGQALYEIFP